MVRGLLMPSVEMSDVSMLPGRKVRASWYMKFFCPSGLPEFTMNRRSTHMYCAPTDELRLAHCGAAGSAGGCTGLGPMWQKPQDMPTRYGRTRSLSL